MREWWHDAVMYQVYPRSFADGSGDGIGDLAGVIDRLDYLQDLGIDAIWLSPHYPSPMADCGYDVADYTGIAPEYGTLDDFKRLLREGERRRIKVLVDLVINHSSDEHTWFAESRSSLTNPKRDWYVWHSGRDGGPPNNWNSTFGGPAWSLDPATGEWYYHFFFEEQPDLNWHNPAVREAMWGAMRFWLDMGVAGFRLDAIGTVFEDPSLADHTSELSQAEVLRIRLESDRPYDDPASRTAWMDMFGHQVDLPEVHEVFKEMRTVMDEYPSTLLLGETGRIEYYGDGEDELHTLFNFPLLETPRLTPAWVRANQESRLAALPEGAWPCNTLGNHDRSRMMNRYGDGANDGALARVHAALLMTLRGTPVIYNGEEIGMRDLPIRDPSVWMDRISSWVYDTALTELGSSEDEAIDHAVQAGRDKCRTPMQWSGAANGGFSPAGVTPWLPVHPNHADGVNVADQDRDPASLLSFYRDLLAARRRLPPLRQGDYRTVDGDSEDVLAFVRSTDDADILVALNMKSAPATLDLPGAATVEFGTHRPTGDPVDAKLNLAPFEVVVATVLSSEGGGDPQERSVRNR